MVQTYNSHYPNGVKTYGGYATYWRGPSDWVFAIPSAMAAAEAAPMLCGGITLYAPLTRFGCGPGKKVGIIGIGGLGHFGLLFAKALGADKVVGISRNSNKRADALKLGAHEYVATEEDSDWTGKHAQTLDIIISTVSSPKVSLDPPYLLYSSQFLLFLAAYEMADLATSSRCHYQNIFLCSVPMVLSSN